jgi:hypothetical protein
MENTEQEITLKEIASLKGQIAELLKEVEEKEKSILKETGQKENRSSWTYDDWQKKDGEGLISMYKNDHSEYTKLFNTWKNDFLIKGGRVK